MDVDAKLTELVAALGVERVIVVDEAHAPQLASVYPVLDELRNAESLEAESAALLEGLDMNEPEEVVFRGLAEAWWSSLATDRQRAIIAHFQPTSDEDQLEEADDDPGDDSLVYAQFWKRWPRDACELVFLTPDEWDASWRSLCAAGGTTITVMDLKFGDAEPEGGAVRLHDLSKFDGGCRRIAVLFTNEVGTQADEEASLWDTLAHKHSIASNFGMVISKKRMSKADRFAKRLAQAAMTSCAREVADIVARRYAELAGAARDDFRGNFDGQVFEKVVLRASEAEGLHPQDTLFRLVDFYLRRARHQVLNDISTELAPQLAEVDALAKVAGGQAPAERLKALRSEEIYSTHFGSPNTVVPPWSGDVWEVQTLSGGRQLFIHLGQPCDLMLRSTGKRAANFFYFVPLRRGALPPNSSLVGAPVPYLKYGNRIEDYWADFKEVVVADANLVDLIALKGPTFSTALYDESGAFEHVTSGVRLRFVEAIAALRSAWPSPSVESAPRLLMTGGLRESWSMVGDACTASATRLCRLEGTHAMEVLHRFAWSLQRVAHETDYAKTS